MPKRYDPISIGNSGARIASVNYLEQATSIWEDYWFINDLSDKVRLAHGQPASFGQKQAAGNYSRLRSFLLGSESAAALSVEDFLSPDSKSQKDNFIELLPEALKGWCSTSRRVYKPEIELQATLEVTSLTEVSWRDDVTLPFPTFAIQFAKPYLCESLDIEFVLVSTLPVTEPGSKPIAFWFFPKQILEYEPIDSDSRRSMLNLFRNNKFQMLEERIVRRLNKILNITGVLLVLNFHGGQYEEFSRKDIFNYLPELGDEIKVFDERVNAWIKSINMALRVTIGFTLYLKSLPENSPHITPVRLSRSGAKARSASNSAAISEEADIFKIAASFKLTRQERVFLGLEGTDEQRSQVNRELSCHFREGYWRRPPGQGQNPEAVKTVQVRFTIVRRDRLTRGQLPAGARKQLA